MGYPRLLRDITIDRDSSGNPVITRIRDFQIVNGGQTTAAIHYTHFPGKM